MAGFIGFTKEQFDALDRLLSDLKRRTGNVLRGTASGSTATASDAYAVPPLGLTVNGASEQDGTPTPSVPVAIDSITEVEVHVGEDGTTDSEGWPVAIDLKGHELRGLPDGTHDELTVDEQGHVTLVQRVNAATIDGSTVVVGAVSAPTSPATATRCQIRFTDGMVDNAHRDNFHSESFAFSLDAISSNKQADGIACLGVANNRLALFVCLEGANLTVTQANAYFAEHNSEVVYKLATPVTHDLGTVTLPATPAPDLTAWAVTDPATTIGLTYERDINLAWPSN